MLAETMNTLMDYFVHVVLSLGFASYLLVACFIESLRLGLFIDIIIWSTLPLLATTAGYYTKDLVRISWIFLPGFAFLLISCSLASASLLFSVYCPAIPLTQFAIGALVGRFSSLEEDVDPEP